MPAFLQLALAGWIVRLRWQDPPPALLQGERESSLALFQSKMRVIRSCVPTGFVAHPSRPAPAPDGAVREPSPVGLYSALTSCLRPQYSVARQSAPFFRPPPAAR